MLEFSKHFIIETNASATVVGAILVQDYHPLAFFSKKMGPKMQATSAYIKELFSVIEAARKWHQYLISKSFSIYTDVKSLSNLLSKTFQTPEQQKWACKL